MTPSRLCCAALANAEPAPRQVIIRTAPSLGHKAIFDLIAAARSRGAEVCVAGALVSPLDVTRLLIRLFEMPMMRVHRSPLPMRSCRPPSASLTSSRPAGPLVLLSPVFAVVAILIKRSWPGPIFYRRSIGLRGRPLSFSSSAP